VKRRGRPARDKGYYGAPRIHRGDAAKLSMGVQAWSGWPKRGILESPVLTENRELTDPSSPGGGKLLAQHPRPRARAVIEATEALPSVMSKRGAGGYQGWRSCSRTRSSGPPRRTARRRSRSDQQDTPHRPTSGTRNAIKFDEGGREKVNAPTAIDVRCRAASRG